MGTLKRAKQSVRKRLTGKASGNRAASSKKPTSTNRQERPGASDETDPVGVGREDPRDAAGDAQAPGTGYTVREDAGPQPEGLRDVGRRLASLREEMEEALLTDAATAARDGDAWNVFRRELDIDGWLRFFEKLGIEVTWKRRQAQGELN